jgi:hypothetical protein
MTFWNKIILIVVVAMWFLVSFVVIFFMFYKFGPKVNFNFASSAQQKNLDLEKTAQTLGQKKKEAETMASNAAAQKAKEEEMLRERESLSENSPSSEDNAL